MAQKRYSVVCNDAGGSSPQTLANIIGSSAVRPRIYEFNVGTHATPADQASDITLNRTTTAGTAGSSPTPAPLDNQEVAAVCTAGIAHSVEPTLSTLLFQCGLNQRASFRWVASPDSEFIGAATSSNGLGLRRVNSTASYAIYGVVYFFE